MTYTHDTKARLVAASASAALAMLTVLAATDVAEARPHHHTINVKTQTEKAQIAETGCVTEEMARDHRGPAHHSASKVKGCYESGPVLATASDARG